MDISKALVTVPLWKYVPELLPDMVSQAYWLLYFHNGSIVHLAVVTPSSDHSALGWFFSPFRRAAGSNAFALSR